MQMGISILVGMFFMFVFIMPARAEDFKEGKWSMTMVSHIDNMPPEMAKAMQQMQNMPAQVRAMIQAQQAKMGVQMSGNGQDMTVTVTHCLTKQNPVPHFMKDGDKQDKYCKQTHDISGNTVNFHAICNYKDTQADSSGIMTYTGNAMEGHIKSHVVHAGQPMDTSINITGQYIGACDQ